MEQNFNHVLLCGQVLTQPQPSHVNHSQSFSRFLLSVPRLSGQEDCLPVIVPQPLLELCPLSPGAAVTVTGQLRSFNNRSGQGPRLVVSVFAQTLQPGGEGPVNRIRLSGVLCKPPTLRCTPLGREICDMHSGGEPALWPSGLPPPYRMGYRCPSDIHSGGGRPSDGGGPHPEPHLHQKSGDRAAGASGL